MFENENELNLEKDRRVFARIPISLPVKLLNLETDKELETNTFDLSAKGLGIVSSRYLERGDLLELWLDMPDKKGSFYTRGAVVWTKLQDSGEYKTGISLDKAEFMGLSRVFRR